MPEPFPEHQAKPRWFDPRDAGAGFGLLSRLPFGGPGRGGADAMAQACWTWPLVGVAVTLPAIGAGLLALHLGLPAGWAAALVLMIQAALTGGIHEDGLADTFDGMEGGSTRERRLEIMRDSRIGSYGALALLLVTLARWSALVVVLPQSPWAVLAVAALSRAGMAALMAALPPARRDGLSQGAGQPGRGAALRAVLVALGLALLFAGNPVTIALVTGGVFLALGLRARARLGGQTGDILGAGQQISEAFCLGVLAAALPMANI
ncbi:adenosylcobinamide-GDP ribazoletransferase [Falsigemmobacter faecalis]|uniref:Adenosylcobinamide-GDP ribazoletransferase n=1 Tax=Falsigemmobacter faecalis TaxID=2488730 RepID=A0A3P3DNF9_9RHOB|nr:adenosylcobinamide-GDP ribazoletransferase [Falsigemmobacter faecalis]RRH75142.1 adenosylcobinamide-GDP ribazoletransferase [Falsigemmobacter faecalis]